MSNQKLIKRPPWGIGRLIGITAMVTAAFLASLALAERADVIFGLLGLVFTATVWMVIRILKAPYCPHQTFDEQFYQDRDDLRRTARNNFAAMKLSSSAASALN